MTSNPCDWRKLPEDLILSDEELDKLICIVLANIERKREILRKYKKMMEYLEARRSSYSQSRSLVEEITRQVLEKRGLSEEEETTEITEEDKKMVEEAIKKLKEKESEK